VLTGIKVDPTSGFLRFPYRQITIIEEGDKADEFMGWASMNPDKFSIKRTFPAFLKGLQRPVNFDARIKGGHRAMILSGELDKVFPFDIYPEYLIKAMQAGDFDRMEKLGIYEIAPEDFALPEFVDTSKQELQKLTRESLERLRKDS
ncbi:MAG: NADH:ubiquinone reductase (Na(+)-transporting) subunit A, partial [Muribaculaceae bacterium]|nr:NADH:ubiquinone reductase (Na(+)-transporting) subunit A [Muribaculaceae bacterium]